MLYLNRSAGNDVSLLHVWNADPNPVAKVLYLNRSTGSDVRAAFVQDEKIPVKVSAAVLYLNRSAGIAVSDVQVANALLNVVNAVLY
jgi:hypothetical protein